jgi:hypothetical protein
MGGRDPALLVGGVVVLLAAAAMALIAWRSRASPS